MNDSKTQYDPNEFLLSAVMEAGNPYDSANRKNIGFPFDVAFGCVSVVSEPANMKWAHRASNVRVDAKTPLVREPHQIGIMRMYAARLGNYVQVTLKRNGKLFSNKFLERHHGGQQATMAIAQIWRDSIITTYPAMSVAQYCDILRSNNSSGVSGVCFRTGWNTYKHRKPVQYAYWLAIIPLGDGRSRRRCFSAFEYGDIDAKRRAIEARQQALLDFEGTPFHGGGQPISVSTPDDMATLQAQLRAKADWSRQLAEGREACRLRTVERIARRNIAEQVAQQPLPQTRRNKTGEPYIERYERRDGKTCYWQVRIERQGKRHGKCFSDSTCGGTAAALDAAKAWRDDIMQRHPVLTKQQAATRIFSNNKSGVSGVICKRKLIKGKLIDAWTALSPLQPGKPQRSKTFRVERYGEREAYALAVQARNAFLAELGDVPHFRRHVAQQPYPGIAATL